MERRVRSAAAVWRPHRPVLRATVGNWHAFPELRTLWLEVIHRLSTGIAREIDRKRGGAGRSPGPDAQQLAATLAWAIERTFYVAGLGVHDYLADEEQAVAAVTSLWRGALLASQRPYDRPITSSRISSAARADPIEPIEISRTGPTAGGDVYSSLG